MRKTALVLTVLMAAMRFSQATEPQHAMKKEPVGFAKLKSLAGDWEGKTPDGKTVRASYKVVSMGSAVVETLNPPGEMDMVTVYHADGDQIMMTHYCATNNQPRMRAKADPAKPNQLAFSYVDATNLSSPEEGHMAGLALTFDDATHFSQAWTWKGPGGGPGEVFRFERKK